MSALSASSFSKSERSLLRRQVRAKRRDLSPSQQSQAAQGLFAQLSQHPDFLFSNRLAFFIPFDGEIDPRLLINFAHKLGKECYLPVIRKDNSDKILFLKYAPGSKLLQNYYTLNEPAVKQCNTVPAWSLDVVFVPLVAFDADCTRLGMGKGYYDRTFEFLNTFERSKPKLLGLAHECQRVEKLHLASWDVPLDKVITDRHIYQKK